MNDKVLKISFGLLSLTLLITLILKLQNVPGGMILSGLFLGLIAIVEIFVGCVLAALLFKFILRKSSFLTLYFISTTIAFLYFYYTLYSPTLDIIVQERYSGEVTLVLSNVKDNILTIDSNGIGYINQWTFDHTYTVPKVVTTKGISINNLCVGFNPSTFWGKGKTCCISGREIQELDFEIVPINKIGQKQYYSKDLTRHINRKLVKLEEPDNYTHIDSVSIKK